MTAFPGQITTMRYGTPGIPWTLTPYYLKVFLTVKAVTINFFREPTP